MSGLLYIFPLTSTCLQGKDKDDQTKVVTALQKLAEMAQPLLIYGDELCGKTLLLFQAAVSYASQGHHVTFISRQPLTRMPLSVHGMTRPDAAGLLKTLIFLYMNTAEELLKYCSSIHMKSLLPDVLVVDGLDYYLDQLVDPSPEAGSARLCALLTDTAAYITMKSNEKKCILLLGCRVYRKTNLSCILKQFDIVMANISAVNLQDRAYQMNLQTRDLDAQIAFTIKPSGLFLGTVSFVT